MNYRNLAVGILALAAVIGIGLFASSQSDGALHDLTSIDELKTLFTQDDGAVRLFLLVSPTCTVCVAGARWVDENILGVNPEANIRVYTIWFKVLGTDSRDRWPQNAMTDPRVTEFWDDSGIVSDYFMEHPELPRLVSQLPVVWDVPLLFGSDATWEDFPTPLVASGYPIIGAQTVLRNKIDELLEDTTR